jgi:hypothetical protein
LHLINAEVVFMIESICTTGKLEALEVFDWRNPAGVLVVRLVRFSLKDASGLIPCFALEETAQRLSEIPDGTLIRVVGTNLTSDSKQFRISVHKFEICD